MIFDALIILSVAQFATIVISGALRSMATNDGGPVFSATVVSTIVAGLLLFAPVVLCIEHADRLALAKTRCEVSAILNCEVRRAEAILQIESTRLGPMSGVIRWVGDYK